MNRETDDQVRDRMQRLELPEAPPSLPARVAEVAATRPPVGTVAELSKSGRLLVPIAAMLLIGGAAIVGSGGGPRPSSQSSNGEPVGPAVATVQILAVNYEFPSHPGGLFFRIRLEGPGGPWSGELDYADLGRLRTVSPRLPEKLAPGSYALRTETHVFGDVIHPGESGPRDYGATATCTSGFVVSPTTTVVSVTLGFWSDQRCAAGTITADDPRTLATLDVIPAISGDCGFDVGGCDYRMTLSGPGGTWGAVVGTVKPSSQLVINQLTDLPLNLSPGTYRLDASSHRMSLEPEPGVGHQSEIAVAGTCVVEFTVAENTNDVFVSIEFNGETCSAEAEPHVIPTAPPPSAVGPVATPFTMSFGAPYGLTPAAGTRLPITKATLSRDRTSVIVEFVGSGSYLPGVPCANNAEPWVALARDTVLVAIVAVVVPSPSACAVVAPAGYLMRYDLELPGVFTGTDVREFGSGQTFEVGE